MKILIIVAICMASSSLVFAESQTAIDKRRFDTSPFKRVTTKPHPSGSKAFSVENQTLVVNSMVGNFTDDLNDNSRNSFFADLTKKKSNCKVTKLANKSTKYVEFYIKCAKAYR
jgi:hypothetical protein